MAEQGAFSPEEWAVLSDTPLAACAAVALADEGGGEREATALLMGWREAGRLFPKSALVQMLVQNADPQERALSEQPGQAAGRSQRTTYEDIRAEALSMCQRAVRLLERRASPQDLEDYRNFVLFLASRVARANSEARLLGGGDRVSPIERAMLREIAAVLGEAPEQSG